jgi:hypothetical protein
VAKLPFPWNLYPINQDPDPVDNSSATIENYREIVSAFILRMRGALMEENDGNSEEGSKE